MIIMTSRYFILLFLFVVLVTAQQQQQQQAPNQWGVDSAANWPQDNCNTIHTRKEWRELSPTEKFNFFWALHQMKRKPGKVKGSKNRYDDFVRIHLQHSKIAHNSPGFFIWHRKFTRDFEYEMQLILGQHNIPFAMPYWQWSFDSQSPEDSPLLQDDAFGSNGDENGCVVDGQVSYHLGWRTGTGYCLQRGGRKDLAALYSPEQIESIIRTSNSYESFRKAYEVVPHGNVHWCIGGHFQTNASPEDPLFFLHHANVDRVYTRWQHIHHEVRWNFPYPDALLKPWNEPAKSWLNTKANGLCYQYTKGLDLRTNRVQKRNKVKVTKRNGNNNNNNHNSILENLNQGLQLLLLVDPFDRKDLDKLREPPAMPREYALKYGFNETEMRNVENQLALVNDKVNALVEGGKYVSKAALRYPNSKWTVAESDESMVDGLF